MKIHIVTLLMVMLFGPLSFFSQKQFEGEIEYEISYLNVTEKMDAVVSKLPYKVIFVAKGTSYKLISKIEDRPDQIQIMHNHDGSGYVLMNILGQQIALENELEEVRKANSEYFKSEIINEDESKKILGFNCKSAIICSSLDTTSVFFTDKFASPEYKYINLKGLPLEYTIQLDEFVIQANAVSVDKRNVEDFEFLAPQGYMIMNKSELEEFFKM